MKPHKHWNAQDAIKQLLACGYECEAGSLAMNDAFIWLKGALEIGPKFLPGQGVWFKVSAEAAGVKLEKWVHFYVVSVSMESDVERRLWTYCLSNDPPAPYHYGTVNFRGVSEEYLTSEKPVAT